MREIVKDIFSWSRLSEPHGYDFNAYLVCAAGNLCIDPIEPDAEDFAELERRGVAQILLTNRNHVRAANAVHERTGAPISIHPEDAEHARGQGARLGAELHPARASDRWSWSACRESRAARSRSTGRSATS